MPLARYQSTAVDDAGNVLPLAGITVTNEVTGSLAVLYSDRDGLVAIGNPFTAEADGSFAFHSEGGAYRIDVSLAAESRTLRYVAIGTAGEYDANVFINANRATVRVATTANITIATALNNGDTLDGVTLATSDRVLVKNQTASAENGVYVVGVSPARAADFATYDDHAGAIIAVSGGAANTGKLYFGAVNIGGTLDTTAITFIEIVGVPGADGSSLIKATSATSLTISAPATKVFTLTEAEERGFGAGVRLRAASAASPGSDYMEGVVTLYSHPSLTVDMDKAAGSGTHTDWLINIAGQPGTAGAGTGDMLAANNLSDVGSVATAATNLGVGTGSSPQFAGVNIGHATDTTVTRTGAGDIAVEGNAIYRAGGTDVPVADGGTGASTAAAAATNLGLGTGDSPQFAGVNIGAATDTTVTRVSAGIIAVEGVTVSMASNTLTLTNKRVTPRVTSIASSATPTVNSDDCDVVNITALAAAITSMTTNLTGTPTIGQKLLFMILDNGTARAITWGASFAAKGVPLPTTTVLSKLLTVGFIWNGTNWGCVASVQEA